MSRGHPVFAALYDRVGEPTERRFLQHRRAFLLSGVRGAVLEIGAGTGVNLGHYQGADRVVVAEPDRHMRRRLARRIDRAGVALEVFEVVDAPAERLPYPDDSFDTVVSTIVLCTVADQAAALAEVHRVLRPRGSLRFIEHVRAEGPMAAWQDRVTPLWRRMGAGCHPNRATLDALRRAGFTVAVTERFRVPGPAAGFLPMVSGTATRRAVA